MRQQIQKSLAALLLILIPGLCAAQDPPTPTPAQPAEAKPPEVKPSKPTPSEGTEPAAPTEPPKPTGPQDPLPTPTEGMEVITTESGLKYIDLKVGDGPEPTPDSLVKVHYSGWLDDGTLFDSSVKKGAPILFDLTKVIKGWIEGIGSMKVGGKRKLIVPPELAYGDKARPTIPANSTLTFEVELLEVRPPPSPTPIEGLEEVRREIVLKYWDIKEGTGPTPLPDGRVRMDYSIWLTDGKLLDSTSLRGAPSWAPIPRLLSGWTEAMLTMKQGGKRRIEIPPSLAFGRRGMPARGIPAEATLILEVELLEVQNPPTETEAAKKDATPAADPKRASEESGKKG